MTEQRTSKQNELLLVVNRDDQPIEPLPRGFVHNNGIWHRVVHIWIIKQGEVLCQQRSLSKDLNPGKWESFFGGHLTPGDSYRDGK